MLGQRRVRARAINIVNISHEVTICGGVSENTLWRRHLLILSACHRLLCRFESLGLDLPTLRHLGVGSTLCLLDRSLGVGSV